MFDSEFLTNIRPMSIPSIASSYYNQSYSVPILSSSMVVTYHLEPSED